VLIKIETSVFGSSWKNRDNFSPLKVKKINEKKLEKLLPNLLKNFVVLDTPA